MTSLCLVPRLNIDIYAARCPHPRSAANQPHADRRERYGGQTGGRTPDRCMQTLRILSYVGSTIFFRAFAVAKRIKWVSGDFTEFTEITTVLKIVMV